MLPTQSQTTRQSGRKPKQISEYLTIPADNLPVPARPPPVTEKYLLSIPAKHRQLIANQHTYALIFNHLEPGDGCLWWERNFVSIDPDNRDFNEPSDLSLKADPRPSQRPNGVNSGENDLTGSSKLTRSLYAGLHQIPAVLDDEEEEEEVPEAEQARTDNNKRLAAYIAGHLILGRL